MSYTAEIESVRLQMAEKAQSRQVAEEAKAKLEQLNKELERIHLKLCFLN